MSFRREILDFPDASVTVPDQLTRAKGSDDDIHEAIVAMKSRLI